jgi:hypothetical protein
MLPRASFVHLVAAVSLTACSVQPAPLPVRGSPDDLLLLAGEWTGSYEGKESGRSGKIYFELSAQADSANGSVLMEAATKPRIVGYKALRGFWREPSATSPNRLTISFVRAEGGGVHGTLNPYTDPDCGCTLHTTFLGHIEGDSITGTFKTLHLESGTSRKGTWEVTRQG